MRGNLGQAPSKVLDEKGLESGGRRWRFMKLDDRLRKTSARPTALPSTDYSLNLDGVAPENTTFSHFSTTLNTQSDNDKTTTFVAYAAAVRPLSLSLPLIYRNRKRLIDQSAKALHESTLNAGEATASITLCISALCQDLGADGFHPLLPAVVVAFANALQTSRPGESNRGEEQKPVSTFWDPQVTLVPIFAALAELTKALLQPLAADPESTLACLAPLLSNGHHRVREMTAEASLGYLIRKTRDASVRNRFVTLLVEGMPEEDIPQKARDDLTDGLGVSLYESIRLPSGQLHSRAIDVLKISVANIVRKNDGNNPSDEGPGDASTTSLKVVARCFASLCRYLTNGFDVQKVTLVLAMEGERAVQSKKTLQLGNMLFLLRNWFGYGGAKFYSLLGEPTCQRFLNFISGALQRFKNHTRIVTEAVSAVCSMYRHASESFRRRSVWTSIYSCLDSLSTSLNHEAVAASLRILLEFRAFEWQRIDVRPLVNRVAKLCERMATTASNNGDTHDNLHVCESAMWSTLTFFRLVTGSSFRSPKAVYSYSVPTLVSQTKAVLGKFIEDRTEGGKTRSTDQVREVLRLWSVVHVPGGLEVLNNLLQLPSWELNDRACLMSAAIRQSNGDSDTNAELLGKAKILLRTTLSSESSALDSASFCAAAERVCKSSEDPMLVLCSDNASDQKLVEKVRVKLTKNLSSRDYDLRKASVSLLMTLHNPTKDDTENDESHSEGEGLEANLQKLRSSLTSDAVSLPGLLSIFSRLFKVSRSLEAIGSNLRLLQEMNKLLQFTGPLTEDVHSVLYHFTMGLFQTPLKPLWKHAGELWVSLAAHNFKGTMSATMEHLRGAELLLNAPEVVDKPDDENEADLPVETVDDTDMDRPNNESMDIEKTDDLQHADSDQPQPSGPFTNRSGKRPRQNSTGEPSAKRQRPNERRKGPPMWEVPSLPIKGLSFTEPTSSINASSDKDTALHGTTDVATFMMEVFNTLAKEPKHTFFHREGIIQLYLRLEPSRFSKRKANLVVTSLCSLLEKMGGLKCCGNDTAMENKMRGRLLCDLARPGAQLQSAALRCLCVSRSAPLKPVRDSLLRLVKDSSFREELTLLTDRQFTENGDPADAHLNEDQVMVAEVLIRICLSKMKGTHGSLESRKGAALTFITSKLPIAFALTKITDLLLESISDCITAMERSALAESTNEELLPSKVILRAVLSSVETVVKLCKRTLPPESWKKVAMTGLLALRNAGVGSMGQNVRSRALKMLTAMYRIRQEETIFVVPHILTCVKNSTVDFLDTEAIIGTPALLTFIEEVCQGNGFAVCLKYPWSISFCSKVLSAKHADPKAICTALVVGKHLSEHVSSQSTESNHNASSTSQLLQEMNSSLGRLIPSLVDRMEDSKQNQKVWGTAFEEALEITEISMDLVAFCEQDARNIVKALCSFLQKPRLSAVSPASSLKTMTALFKGIGGLGEDEDDSEGGKERLIYDMIPMLSARRFVKDDASFQALCELLSAVGPPDLQCAMELVKGMNAMQKARLGSPDFDRRLDSINTVLKATNEALKTEGLSEEKKTTELSLPGLSGSDDPVAVSSPTVLLSFCHGCVGAIYSEDTAVRGIAGFCLKQLSRWVALSDSPCARFSRSDFVSVVLQGTCTAKRIVIRREFCHALGEIARCSETLEFDGVKSDSSFIPLLRDLVSNDPEVDFYENVVHLQAHRRSRALRNLEKYMSQTEMDSSRDEESRMKKTNQLIPLASEFVLPLGKNIALETPDKEDIQRLRRMRKQPGAREHMAMDVSQWAISVVAAACKLLPWQDYTSAVDSLLRKVEHKNDDEDDHTTFRLLVKVIESFPRPSEARCPVGDELTTYLIDTLLPRMLKHVSSGAIQNDLLHHSEKITNVVTRGRSEVHFRAPVALAIAKLLNYITDERQGTLVPLLITPLITSLRSKTVTVREASKKALVSVIIALGSKYLSRILHQVYISLKDGFRKDMIVFFVHALLSAVRDSRKRETDSDESLLLDSGVDGLISQAIEELRSGVSEDRREYEDPNANEARLKAAAVRTSRAYDCAELLGELMTFKKSAVSVARPLLTTLSKSASSKLIGRAGEATRRLLMGISRNPSLDAEASFRLCHSLFSAEDVTVNVGGEEKMFVIGKEFSSVKKQFAVSFALRLLHTTISKNVELINSKEQNGSTLQALCEPFPSYVVDALKQNNDELTTFALRTAQKLVLIQLQNKGEFVEKLCDAITDVLSESASHVSHRVDLGGNQDLFNTCLRMAAVLYKEGRDSKGAILISDDKVEVFMTIAKNCLENGGGETLSASLSLIRSVVNARVVHPSVYDILEDVRKFAVVTQSTSLRSTCATLITKFLVHYPMRPKLLKQYVEFFVRNLNYERPSGRLSAIQAIREIAVKQKGEFMDKESQYVFIALAACLSRETDTECRDSAFDTVRVLFARLSKGQPVAELLKIAATLAGVQLTMMFANEEPTLVQTEGPAIVQSGAVCLAAACKSGNMTATQLGLIIRVCTTALGQVGTGDEWETEHALLQCAEAAYEAQAKDPQLAARLELQSSGADLWLDMPTLLLHRHQWVRFLAANLLGRHLSAAGGRKATPEYLDVVWSIWGSAGLPREILRASCLQLEADHLSTELAQQCLKNILCLADVVRQHPRTGDLVDNNADDDDEIMGDGELTTGTGAAGDADDKIEQVRGQGGNRCLRWLLSRMNGIATKTGTEERDILRRACALRFFLVTAKWWGDTTVREYLALYVGPVMKVLESGDISTDVVPEQTQRRRSTFGRNGRVTDEPEADGRSARGGEEMGLGKEALRTISETLQAALVESVGADEYYAQYRTLQGRRTEMKQEMKRREAMLAAIDPERSAKQRRKRTEAKKAKRRLKGSVRKRRDELSRRSMRKESLTSDL